MSDSKVVSVVERVLPEPVAPKTYTFEQLRQMAVSFAKSGLFGVKDPDSALSLLLIAESEGKSPAAVMKDFDIIQGRPAKKSEAMLRDFQASGGRVEWVELTDSRAAAKFSHPLAPVPILIDWDLERAKKAGLLGKSGDMYSKYARAMLRSRCISEGVRSTAPGATSQLYTPEEVMQIAAEEPPKTVSENAAVADAVDQIKADAETPKDDIDELIDTLDVPTLALLSTAFENAWKATKGNKAARERVKVAYDAIKAGLEAPAP
jgi:hypothetical protein